MKLLKLFSKSLLLTFVLLTVTATTHAKKPDNPGGGGGNGGGGSSVVYEATLVGGGFVFNTWGVVNESTVPVTPFSRENGLRSTEALDMIRSHGDESTWNQVFNTCEVLLAEDTIDSFDVDADDWTIEKAGGVRVIFRNVVLPLVGGSAEGAKVTVQLIGNEFDFTEPFLPEPESSREYTLDQGAIYGRSVKGEDGPKRACQPSGGGGFDIFTLEIPSTLVITAESKNP